MRNLTLVDVYRHYKAEGGNLPKSVFKNMCADFNSLIMDYLIYDAGTFDMGNNLSTLSVARIKRSYKNPAVNWVESNKFKDELTKEGKELYNIETGKGHKWLVYHEEEWYCRFYWAKKFSKFKNKSVYKFIATRGDRGNKTKLKDHLNENEINYIKYRNLSA